MKALFATLALAAPLAAAQVCTPLVDINVTPVPISGMTSEAGFTVQGVTYFAGYTVAHGIELHRTDGTPAGTTLVKDLAPGTASSGPLEFVEHNGVLYFTARTPEAGREVWRSDGTAPGTWMLRDIEPGAGDGVDPERVDFLSFGGALYFTAMNAATGAELWKSDGTPGGTLLVLEALPGKFGASPANKTIAPNGAEFYFSASLGGELWRTDGSAAGTVLLADLVPGEALLPRDFINVGTRTVFVASSLAYGSELWVTDGTTAGTHLLADLQPGSQSSIVSLKDAALVQGQLYFSTADSSLGIELWVTDGTRSGTRLYADLEPGFESSYPSNLTELGGALYFTATKNQTERLYRIATPGSAPIAITGTTAQDPKNLTNLFAAQGRVYFSARTNAKGRELWFHDGTSAHMLADLAPGPANSSPTALVELANGDLMFAADDGVRGVEAYVTDGTTLGTRLLVDIEPTIATASSNPSKLTSIGGHTLYFTAGDGVHGLEPYVWTQAAGAILLKDIEPGPASGKVNGFVQAWTGSGAFVFFVGKAPGQGYALWKTQGTPASTDWVAAFPTAINNLQVRDLTAALGQLFFVAPGSLGSTLYVTDGTFAGTRMVSSPAQGGVEITAPKELTQLGNRLIFQATGADGQVELYTTDGTQAGTQRLVDIHAGVSSEPRFLTVVGAQLAFAVRRAVGTGTELWKTDGTAVGTQLISEISASSGSGPINTMHAWDDRLVFAARAPLDGLWVSDLTPAGTHVLFDHGNQAPSEITPVGSRVFFNYGSELYVTGAVPQSATHLTTAPSFGPLSNPEWLFPTGFDVLFATAYADGPLPNEVYRSNGTGKGTRLFCDVSDTGDETLTGVPVSSDPQQFVWVDGQLVLVASAPHSVGRELFVAALSGAYAQDFGLTASGLHLQATPPVLGANLNVRGDHAPIGSSKPTILGVGPSLSAPLTLPLLTGGAAWIDPAASSPLASFQSESWTWQTMLPMNPSLVGLALTIQAWTWNPSSALATTSNGVRLQLGY